jgi:sugar lactone lactonase YvrE
MTARKNGLKPVGLITSAVVWCAVSVHAQSGPTITNQPTSHTNLAGTSFTFIVGVGGTGPFTYQWQFNGTNFPNNIITTVAGNGTYAYAGDGGPATNASLRYPQGVGFDAAGNLYIADNDNNRVRKVDANGIITTVAGDGNGSSTGSGRYAGDGGAATNASLYRPNNVAWDAAGNLLIADIFNDRIRRVDTHGIITTVAGKSGRGYSGDGEAATNAELNLPASVALDAMGELYIADLDNNRIRKVDTNGIITTVAGNGRYGYAVDGGPATNASLSNPQGAAVDLIGNLYIADTRNYCIRKVNKQGIITTVAGRGGVNYPPGDGGAATNGGLSYPWFVTLDAIGELYIADHGNNRIRKVDTNGIITTVAGNGNRAYGGDGGAATNASLNGPACVALDAAGNLYIADWYNNRIREVHFAGFPTLTLSNVSVANAGNYSVVVTSKYGSATSEVAVLTVTVPRSPPQIIVTNANFGIRTNRFGFNLSGAFGQTIVVDGSTNLADWLPLATNSVGGSLIYFSDPGWTNFPWRYYRARLP